MLSRHSIANWSSGEEVSSPTTFYPQQELTDSTDLGIDDWIFQEQVESRFTFNKAVWSFLVTEKKVKLNIIDDFGETPLSYAIRLHRDEVILKLLTNHSVDVDLCCDNNPPFHVYCQDSRLSEDIFKIFLTRVVLNRQVNRVNFEERTPLHCLINNIFGEEDPFALIPFVIKLVDAGADLSKQDSKGLTPYMLAIHHGFPYDVLRHFIPKSQKEATYSLNLKNNNGYNALALTLLKYQGEDLRESCDDPTIHPLTFKTSCGDSGLNSTQNSVYFKCNWNQKPMPIVEEAEGPVIVKGTCGPGEVGPKELELHLLVEKLLLTGAKLDAFICHDKPSLVLTKTSTLSKVTQEEKRESLLSLLIQNKHLSFRTFRLLMKKSVINTVNFCDIWNCLLHFRLDVLYELVRFAESKNNKKVTAQDNAIYKMIQKQKGLSINILDHIYSFRHIYLQTMNVSNGSSAVAGTTSMNGMTSSASSSSLNSILINNMAINPNDAVVSRVTKILSHENMNRVHPLIVSLVDSFGHSVNQVILSQTDVEISRKEVRFTLIHALIQAHSWVPLPLVLDYLLVDKKDELDINVTLNGRGSPLNYAIRLGEFSVAERLVSMKADTSSLDLNIPVLPLKRGFSQLLRKLMSMGVKIPKDFGQQIMYSRIEDPILEVEFLMFMDEVRSLQRRDQNRICNGNRMPSNLLSQGVHNGLQSNGRRSNLTFHSRRLE